MMYISADGLEVLDQALKELPDKAPKAVYRTINDTMRASLAAAKKSATSLYEIRSRTLNNRIKVRRASLGKLESVAVIKSPTLIAARFGISPRNPKNGKQRKISMWVFKRSKKSKEHLKHVFVVNKPMAPLLGEHVEGSNKLRWLYGPSAPQVMGNAEVCKAFSDRTKEYVGPRLDHYMQDILAGDMGVIK